MCGLISLDLTPQVEDTSIMSTSCAVLPGGEGIGGVTFGCPPAMLLGPSCCRPDSHAAELLLTLVSELQGLPKDRLVELW